MVIVKGRLIVALTANRRLTSQVLRWVLKAHSALYDLAGVLAVRSNGGVHPKHDILRYKEWFLEHIEAGDTVLDIGSNTGALPALLASKADFVYGIEIDERLSAIARRTHVAPNLEYLTGDATTFDYTRCRPVNVVTLSNVLEHLQDRVVFLRRLQGQLVWHRPERALFLIRVPTIERDWISVYKKGVGVDYLLDRTHAIEHTKSEFIGELRDAGLELLEFDTRFGEFYAVCRGCAR